MNCEWCNTHIGKRIFLVSSSWSLCLSCNADCTQFFPRWVTYIGKNEGQHQFIYDEPVICPGCGSRSDGCQQFCDNDGETIELPPCF